MSAAASASPVLRLLSSALVACALGVGTGCSNLQIASAGEVGCAPKEIAVSNKEHSWNASSWTATCGTKLYQCSSLATAWGVDYACKLASETEVEVLGDPTAAADPEVAPEVDDDDDEEESDEKDPSADKPDRDKKGDGDEDEDEDADADADGEEEDAETSGDDSKSDGDQGDEAKDDDGDEDNDDDDVPD